MRTQVLAVAIVSVAGVLGLGPAGCGRTNLPRGVARLQVESPSFPQGGEIPKEFTCDGGSVSPALRWQAAPSGTQSLVLIVTDRSSSAGALAQWTLYNMPPTARGVTEGVPRTMELPGGSRQGFNNDNSIGYWGPCVEGEPTSWYLMPFGHRYYFTVYALDEKPDVPAAIVGDAQLQQAMEGHVLAAGELVGRCHRCQMEMIEHHLHVMYKHLRHPGLQQKLRHLVHRLRGDND